MTGMNEATGFTDHRGSRIKALSTRTLTWKICMDLLWITTCESKEKESLWCLWLPKHCHLGIWSKTVPALYKIKASGIQVPLFRLYELFLLKFHTETCIFILKKLRSRYTESYTGMFSINFLYIFNKLCMIYFSLNASGRNHAKSRNLIRYVSRRDVVSLPPRSRNPMFCLQTH